MAHAAAIPSEGSRQKGPRLAPGQVTFPGFALGRKRYGNGPIYLAFLPAPPQRRGQDNELPSGSRRLYRPATSYRASVGLAGAPPHICSAAGAGDSRSRSALEKIDQFG